MHRDQRRAAPHQIAQRKRLGFIIAPARVINPVAVIHRCALRRGGHRHLTVGRERLRANHPATAPRIHLDDAQLAARHKGRIVHLVDQPYPLPRFRRALPHRAQRQTGAHIKTVKFYRDIRAFQCDILTPLNRVGARRRGCDCAVLCHRRAIHRDVKAITAQIHRTLGKLRVRARRHADRDIARTGLRSRHQTILGRAHHRQADQCRTRHQAGQYGRGGVGKYSTHHHSPDRRVWIVFSIVNL